MTVGPSIPVGRFGDKNYLNNYGVSTTPSGLAKVGAGVDVSGEYRINKSLGAILLIGGSMNKLDPDGLRKYLEESDTSKVYTYANTHDWQIIKILTGITVTLPFSRRHKFDFAASLLMGASKTSKPEYIFGMGSRPGFYNLNFSNKKISLPWTFSYQIGINGGYKLLRNLFLVSAISYFNGYPVYKYNTVTLSGQSMPFKAKFALGSVNIKVGAKVML